MKRIITIAALLVLVFSSSFAQPTKWKILAGRILGVFNNGSVAEFSAIEAKGTTILAAWTNIVLSTDKGKSWTGLSLPWTTNYITDVAIYDQNTFAIASNTGLFYTYDRGNTWGRLAGGEIWAVVFDDSPDNLIYISPEGSQDSKVVVSHSGIKSSGPNLPYELIDLNRGADGAFYTSGGVGSTRNTLLRSADHGISWQVISLVDPGDDDCYTFICDKDDARRFVMVNEDWAYRTDSKSQLFLTSDAGASWSTTLSKDIISYTYLMGNSAQGCNDYFVGSLTDGILRSRDKGTTWESIGGPVTPVDSRSLFAVDDSTLYIIDERGSIWVSDAAAPSTVPIMIGDSTLAHSSIRLCDSSSRDMIVFKPNISCAAPLEIDTIYIIGRNSHDYSIERQLTFPRVLPDSVRIRFIPSDTGKTNAVLIIKYPTGEIHYYNLATTVLPQAPGPVTRTGIFQVLQLPLCDTSAHESFVFDINTDCNTLLPAVSVEIVGLDAADYNITEPLHSPPVSPDSIMVRFVPSHAGKTDAQLKVTYQNGEVRFVDLSTTVTPPTALSITTSAGSMIRTDTLGGDIVIPVTLQHSTDISSTFRIRFDTKYLVFRGMIDPSNGQRTVTNADGTLYVSCNPASDSVIFFMFSFFPVDSNCTEVTIDSLTAVASGLGCTSNSGSIISVTICGPSGCGISTLSKFIRYGTIPEFSITPNPSRGTITLRSNVDIDGATIEIRNEVGAISYSTHSDLRNVDGVSLDVSSLPSGAYILLVKGHGAGVPLVIMK